MKETPSPTGETQNNNLIFKLITYPPVAFIAASLLTLIARGQLPIEDINLFYHEKSESRLDQEQNIPTINVAIHQETSSSFPPPSAETDPPH